MGINKFHYFLLLLILYFVSCSDIPSVSDSVVTGEEKIIEYVVRFESNGGTLINNQSVKKNHCLIEPEPPKKKHFHFFGWYTDVEFNKAFDFNSPIKENMTLYARWELNICQVTFDTNGGSSIGTLDVEQGANVNEPLQPNKRGYVFAGWYTDKSLTDKFDFDSKIVASMTIYAKWIEQTYSISISDDFNGRVYCNKMLNLKSGEEVSVYLVAHPDFNFNPLITINISDDNNEKVEYSRFGTSSWIARIEGRSESVSGKGCTLEFIMPDRNVNIITSECSVYNFHEIVEELATGTDGTAGINAKYVLFGDYPQTIVSKEKEKTIAFCGPSITCGKFTYILGNDGNYYCAQIESAYRYSSAFYSDGSKVNESSDPLYNRRYFKVEPMKWRILTSNYDHDNDASTPGKKLLLSEKIVDVGNFYGDSEFLNSTPRVIDSKKIYSNNYEHSDIRNWLKQIYDASFSTAAKDLILTTTVINDGDSTTDYLMQINKADGTYDSKGIDYTCNNLQDKLFLLSLHEITDPTFGFLVHSAEDHTRIRYPTDYSKARGIYRINGVINGNSNYDASIWWLRSPSFYSDHSVWYCPEYVWDEIALSWMNVNNYHSGIVPALCIE